MKKLMLSTLLLPLCLILTHAMAQETDPLSLTHDFTRAQGYESLDEMELEALVQAQLPALVHIGQLSPFAVPVHVMEALDGKTERARHHLSVSVGLVPMPPAADPVPVLFVQLDRYNLGPLTNAELIEAYGVENVAPLEDQDLAPHVSYRLVLHQLMGREASMLAVSRREINEDEAAGNHCLGSPCLQTWNSVPDMADWMELQAVEPTHDTDILEPAGMLDLLAAMAFFEPYSHEAAFDARTHAITIAHMVVEANLAQERSTEGALRVGELRDDSVAAVWQRLVAFDTGAASFEVAGYAADAFECQRGISEDGYCL